MTTTDLPRQPNSGEDPWYAVETAWKDGVELNIGELDDQHETHVADATVHVPPGGAIGQTLVKASATDGDTAWATASGGGVTDHGALTGLNDPDHPISAVINLQASLDAKSATSHTHSYEAVGVAAGLDAAHLAAGDPHSQYMTPAEGSALFVPLAQGIPAGGTTGQVLAKTSATNYATGWASSPAPAAPLLLTGTDPATVPLTAKAAAAQSTNILSTQLSDGTQVMTANSTGEVRLGPGTTSMAATVRVGVLDPARKGVSVRLAVAQTANGWEIQNSAGTVLAAFNSDGLLAAPNVDRRVSVLSATADPSGLPDNTVILRRP